MSTNITNITSEREPDAPRRRQQSLGVFVAPESVAIFGATEAPNSAGRVLMENLIRFPCGATLFPINPKRKGVLGIRAYTCLEAASVPIDLAIVATPATAVPDVIRECQASGVKGAIIISDGFRNGGAPGAELEQQIVAELRRGQLQVLGPSCLGVVCPRTGLNATFAPAMVRSGGVGFLSQSGSLLTALLSPEWSDHVGCSAFISLGSMLGVGWPEWLEYLGNDPQTAMIGVYAETLGDTRAFVQAARAVTPRKPIILVKSGRLKTTACDTDGQTKRLVDRNDVLEDLLCLAGVLRVESISDLLRMAEVLSTQPVVRGRRLMIISNASGPARLAMDAVRREGGELAVPTPATAAALDALLPSRTFHENLIDLRDDASAERFAQAAAIGTNDANSDALLLLLAPYGTIDPFRTAELVSHLNLNRDRPILASWMWGAATPAIRRVLNDGGISTFATPELAVRALRYAWQHADNLQDLRQDSASRVEVARLDARSEGERLVETARSSGRTELTGGEACQLFAAYFLQASETCVADNPEVAVHLSAALGYPVALALCGRRDPLPADVAAVRLHATDAHGVIRAYRSLGAIVREHVGIDIFPRVRIQPMLTAERCIVSLHCSIDPHLGPVLRFVAVDQGEVVPGSQVIALPPITSESMQRLFRRRRFGEALQSLCKRHIVAPDLLGQFLVSLSQLVVEQRSIKAVQIDSLLMSRERVVALGPFVRLHSSEVRDVNLLELTPGCDSPDLPRAEPSEPSTSVWS
jgi:acetyltransferase